jgi:hypothetical protein
MQKIDFTIKNLLFTVDGQRGVPQASAERFYKKMYAEDKEGMMNMLSIIGPNMMAFANHLNTIWDEIPELRVTEAFAENNLEIRRLFFKAIGVQNIFAKMNPELIDTQIIKFTNAQWYEDGTPKEPKVIRDKYELYKIEGKKLFPEQANTFRVENATVYAVRCWCTTTEREYWIYVPRWVGEKEDAIEAIAWTAQLNISEPEWIYRQGDVFIAKASAKSEFVRPYHLNKDAYLKLLKAQS